MDRQRENSERRRRFGRRITVRVEKELHNRVEGLARDSGVPVSEVYRDALRRGVENLVREWRAHSSDRPVAGG